MSSALGKYVGSTNEATIKKEWRKPGERRMYFMEEVIKYGQGQVYLACIV